MTNHNEYIDEDGRTIDPDWGEVPNRILSLDEYYTWNSIFWSSWVVEFMELVSEG